MAQGRTSKRHSTADVEMAGDSDGRKAARAAFVDHLRKFADGSAPILVTGQAGSGKSALVRQMHEFSLRAREPFVEASLNDMLPDQVAPTLFGVVAADGTGREIPGLIDMAAGGTLFLDEINGMNASTLARLVLMMESGTFTRVGSDQPIETKARVVVASNTAIDALGNDEGVEALSKLVGEYRLRVPSLEDRGEQLPEWAHQFLAKAHSSRGGSGRVVFTEGAIARLSSVRRWPGNLRQLDEVVQRAYLLARRRVTREFDEVQVESDDVEQSLAAGGLSEAGSGLSLLLGGLASALDRALLDLLVAGIAGPVSDCRIVEYRELEGSAVVRLEGSRREDLEAVAEALYHRIWELQERAQRATLAQLAQALAPQTVNVNAPVGTQIIVQHATFGLHAELAPVVTRLQKLQDALGANLSDLVDRLERMELRLPSEEAAADQSAAAAARRELKLVRTWEPGTHPRTALDRLLATFDPDEVRLLAAQGPEGAEVVANLPAAPATPAHVGAEMVAELLRRGLVDEGFFARVVAAHPDRAEEVRRVAGMWSGGWMVRA